MESCQASLNSLLLPRWNSMRHVEYKLQTEWLCK